MTLVFLGGADINTKNDLIHWFCEYVGLIKKTYNPTYSCLFNLSAIKIDVSTGEKLGVEFEVFSCWH